MERRCFVESALSAVTPASVQPLVQKNVRLLDDFAHGHAGSGCYAATTAVTQSGVSERGISAAWLNSYFMPKNARFKKENHSHSLSLISRTSPINCSTPKPIDPPWSQQGWTFPIRGSLALKGPNTFQAPAHD